MAVAKTLKLDKSGGGGVEIEPGSHIGLLVSVIHVGSQKQEFKGVTSIVDKVLLQFELQDILTESGKPVTVSKVERNSMREKANLPKIGKALGADINEGIDFEALIGKPVMVNMDKSESGKTTIKGFSPVPALLKAHVKPLIGTPKLYLDVDEITDAQVSELSDWIKKMITERVGTSSSTNTSSDEDTVEL